MKELLHFLKKSGGILTACLMLFVWIASSCEHRNPQAEFEQLRDTVFSSPEEGIAAIQEYLDHFKIKDTARINEVSKIRDQYNKMVVFNNSSFKSYADFLEQSKGINDELSSSRYKGVRVLWSPLYEGRREKMLSSLMDSIDISSFNEFFIKEVKVICKKEFKAWGIDSVLKKSLDKPTLTDDGTEKVDSGEYHISLSLHYSGGWVPSQATIVVKGTIGPDRFGKLQENLIRYDVTERPTNFYEEIKDLAKGLL